MISISAKCKRKPAGSRNAPTPQRLAKADAPVKVRGVYLAGAAEPQLVSANDPLKHWLTRGVISKAHHDAGRQFQRLFEKASLGAEAQTGRDARATRIDCAAAALTPACTLARSELDALKPLLGAVDFNLLCNVLGRGRDLEEEARCSGERGKAYVARRIRDALNLLAMREARE